MGRHELRKQVIQIQQFMIGQYGGYEEHKFNRDFREGFHGIEACSFTSDEDVLALKNAAQSHGFRIGVHFPFRAGRSPLRDALLLSTDEAEREEAYRLVAAELEELAGLKPEYVLFHYPKPVILDERVNWNGWRFADSREYICESDISSEELEDLTRRLFEWLAAQSSRYSFTPVLEFDALNRYVYEHDFLEQLLQEFPQVNLCLDTARLYLQERLDPYFDAKSILHTYTKYAHLIHLSNVQVQEEVRNSHHPVLPELSPRDGWAPIEEYLHIIRSCNPTVKIMFEHRSDLLTEEDLLRCYEWVNGILY
ncbi:TIM barrel protein [Paenibacillus tengchongensis]|uniref:TIM barrel protein n=1 Tax=Paenibacillus tengchongensis TaxID=2608684 RepID=UPI001FEAC827|nr:TIM barrel protein [Paenibacillus tengchongensis]